MRVLEVLLGRSLSELVELPRGRSAEAGVLFFVPAPTPFALAVSESYC